MPFLSILNSFFWTVYQYSFLSLSVCSFMCWNLHCTFGIILLVFIWNSNWAHSLKHTTLPIYFFSLLGSNDKQFYSWKCQFLLQVAVKKTHLLFTWKGRELSAWCGLISVTVGLFYIFLFVFILGGKNVTSFDLLPGCFIWEDYCLLFLVLVKAVQASRWNQCYTYLKCYHNRYISTEPLIFMESGWAAL